MAYTAEQLKRQQALYGGIATGIGGLGSLALQNQTMMQQANNINVQAPQIQSDVNGKPGFGALQLAQQQENAIQPQGATGAEVANGALTGAETGAAIGSFIPGIGTAIGAGIGAIGGAISDWFGGEDRKTEMEKRKNLARANIRTAQMQYNSMMSGYNNKQLAMSQYNDMNNNSSQRIQNLYTFNSQRT